MLVLTRKEGEQIRIGDNIIITVVRTNGDKVRLGIEAPADTLILRSELKVRQNPVPDKKAGLGTLDFSTTSGYACPVF
ncbi:MAG: carbon storage regulator [Planctomycetaceae bacterium]|nr:carbon storage regulator [Planctomycetaceae bacterium]